MAIGDDAAAAGYPLVPSTGTGAEVSLGAQEINRTRDFIADLKTLLGNYKPVAAVWKDADLERTATTVLPDPDLSYPLQANSKYMVEGNLNFAGTRDMPISWSIPTGANGFYSMSSNDNPDGVVTDSHMWLPSIPVLLSHTRSGAIISGMIFTSAAAGNITFNWGLYVAGSGDNMTLRNGSCLKFTKVA